MTHTPFFSSMALSWVLLYAATAQGQASPAASADVNRDGVVSQAEAEFSSSLRLEFDDLDRNRDGRLDPSEVSGLAPAPPGAVPVLPDSAIGRPAGTVTPGSGMAGATPSTAPRTAPGSFDGARGNNAVPGSAAGAPPAAPAVPGSTPGPAGGSPFRSPFGSPPPAAGSTR